MLSKQQTAQKSKFMTHYHIWERDLLECARRWPAWTELAHDLGFTDQKISQPWMFADEGRLVQYMEIK